MRSFKMDMNKYYKIVKNTKNERADHDDSETDKELTIRIKKDLKIHIFVKQRNR